MPGKHGTQEHWRYMENLEVLRTVTAPDAKTPAGIEAITERIDRTAIYRAYDNLIQIFACPDAGVTAYTVSVWAEANKVTGNKRWCLVAEYANLSGSQLLSVPNLPGGIAKVAVTSMTGSGSIALQVHVSQ